MDIEITFNVLDSDVQSDIRTLADRTSASGLKFFLENVADPFLQSRVRQRFASEGDDAVGPWLPLSPATEAIRQNKGYSGAHPINIRTSDMYDYLTSSRADVSTTAASSTLTFPPAGANTLLEEKIRTAQMGKRYPATPARPVLGLSMTDVTVITHDLAEYMMKDLMGTVI